MTTIGTEIITASSRISDTYDVAEGLTVNYYAVKTADLTNIYNINDGYPDALGVYSLFVVGTAGGGVCDSVFIYDVTRREGRARELIMLLSENGVTPCCVRDVLEDVL